jgi:hypothetical protein
VLKVGAYHPLEAVNVVETRNHECEPRSNFRGRSFSEAHAGTGLAISGTGYVALPRARLRVVKPSRLVVRIVGLATPWG